MLQSAPLNTKEKPMVITLQVDDKIAGNFLWFLGHFSKDEIKALGL